ncbi:MAG: hypothetical protein HGA66_17780 [Holophaga sp.]|nr:hypothetical protein [Holophaga sp.]
MLKPGATTIDAQGTMTSGYVLEATAKALNPDTPVQNGTFKIELNAFSPSQDMPGQKAGTWYVRGDWQITKRNITAAEQEARLRTEDPEKTTPTREAMAGLDALSLQNYFDPGPQLLQDLDKATLLEERPDTLDGRSLKLLSLKLEPRLGARDRKYVKELDATAKVWVDAEGLPVAAETRVKVRGKALLVISFSSEQHDAYRFARVNGRLVTVHHLHESSGSGGGESGQSRRVTTLAF